MKDVDPAFHGIGSHKAGIDIWHVHNQSVTAIPKDEHGKFYSGDAYVILKTKALRTGGLAHAVHYWLGKETSPEDAAAAATKAVQLDAALGPKAVQYREAQGHESDLLLSYFRPCIIALPGGRTSGKAPGADGKSGPRLFHVKGRRFVHVRQVPLARSSLSHSDVYVLDTGDKIYQFNGANASKVEKIRALDVTRAIKDNDHGGACQVAIVEDGKLDDADSGEFWAAFGGFAPIAKKSTSDDDVEPKSTPARLTWVSKAGAKEVATGGGLKKADLESAKCYLVDCGAEVFVWAGRITSLEDRQAAAKAAQDLLRTDKRPPAVRVVHVAERFETPAFKAAFEEWPAPPAMAVESSSSKLKAMLKQSGVVDVKAGPKGAAPAPESTPGPHFEPSGKLEVWRVENGGKVAVGGEEAGRLYSGECYLVDYVLVHDRKSEHNLFLWLGRDTSKEARAAAGEAASKLHESQRGGVLLARVVQGKEPEHFLSLFKGPLIFLKGSRNSDSGDAVALFHAKGTPGGSIRVTQRPAVASSLSSSECFVLQTSAAMFVWIGSTSTDADRTAAQTAVELLKPRAAPKPVTEGKETSTFWMHLGGKGDHPSQSGGPEAPRDARLFSCSPAPGKLKVMEVPNFVQDDLYSEDTMVLDTVAEIFIWVGAHVGEKERKEAFGIAQSYADLVAATEGRSRDTPLLKVLEGFEPPMFTAYFAWDPSNTAAFGDPFERKVAQLKGQRSLQLPDAARRRLGATSAAPEKEAQGAAPTPTPPGDATPAPPPGEAHGEQPPPSAASQRAAAMAALSSSLGPSLGAPPGKPAATLAAAQAPSTPPPTGAPSEEPPPPMAEEAPSPGSQRARAIAALTGVLSAEKGLTPQKAQAKPAPSAAAAEPQTPPPATESAPSSATDPPPPPDSGSHEGEASNGAASEGEGTFSYDRLISASTNPAPGIDTFKRETYLSPADFEAVFGMSKEAFQQMPKWKRDQKKKALDLF